MDFSLLVIKCLRFLIMTFSFSFRTSYDRGRLLCFMLMPFLCQRFCLSVLILTVFLCEIFGKEWVVLRGLGVSVTNESCGSKSLTKGRFVRNWLLNNFWAGEISFSLCCEFKHNKARYSFCWQYFAPFKVCLTVWIDRSTKPFDCW